MNIYENEVRETIKNTPVNALWMVELRYKLLKVLFEQVERGVPLWMVHSVLDAVHIESRSMVVDAFLKKERQTAAERVDKIIDGHDKLVEENKELRDRYQSLLERHSKLIKAGVGNKNKSREKVKCSGVAEYSCTLKHCEHFKPHGHHGGCDSSNCEDIVPGEMRKVKCVPVVK